MKVFLLSVESEPSSVWESREEMETHMKNMEEEYSQYTWNFVVRELSFYGAKKNENPLR